MTRDQASSMAPSAALWASAFVILAMILVAAGRGGGVGGGVGLGLWGGGACAGAVGLSLQGPVWAAAACLVLLAALSRFFFPSRFMIDADGITARYLLHTQQIKWCDIRRFVQDDRGGYISTRAKRSWLDAYRGMHILFGIHREAVIERIRARLSDGAGAWAH